jgi:YebC/PmpR family DNA-binding regulatory protein
MAGHSHWANIQIKKGAADKRKGKLFGKLSRALIVAAHHGGADPASNLALRYAIDKARKASMPKDNIERAIKKGVGDNSQDSYSEVVYEGYGPGGVAVLCDILTENRNRTAGEIRKIFEVAGGRLGSAGCVAWMFDRKGVFLVPSRHIDENTLYSAAIDAGADDVKLSGESYEILSAPEAFQKVAEALEAAKVPVEVGEIQRVPASTVDLDADNSRRMLKLIEALEDQDDVQSVTANYNIPDEIMAEAMSGA